MAVFWLNIPCDGLSTELPELQRGAEVWCSFRPPELQNAERFLWNFNTKDKLPSPTFIYYAA